VLWGIEGQDAERLAEVLAQCPALAHLDLSFNSNFGAGGAERLAGVLGRCRELENLTSAQPGHRGLQECWRSAQRWLASISSTIGSKLSGKGGLELRGVAQPLALFFRHLALLALCHLFSRQTTRKSDILCTYAR
jgi:hypothetical protein